MRRFRQEIRVNPLDTQQNIAIGVSIPFNGTPVYNSTYTTKDQINSNIINWALTNRGERYFNPNFGGNIRSFLFEQSPSLDQLHDFLTDNLALLFPQVTVNDVEVNVNDDNSVGIIISYSVGNTSDQVNIQIQP